MPSMKYKKIKIYIQRAKIFVPMSLCRGGWWRTWSCPCCHPGSWLAGRVSGDWARTGPSWLFPVPSSPHQPSWVQRSETRARWQGRADHARPARPPPSLVRAGWRSALAGTRLALLSLARIHATHCTLVMQRRRGVVGYINTCTLCKCRILCFNIWSCLREQI